VGFDIGHSSACILDLQNDTSLDIMVDWTVADPVLQTGLATPTSAGNLSMSTVPGSATLYTSNGYLLFEVVNPLMSQYSGTTAHILVYARGGPDFALYGLDSGSSCNAGLVTITTSGRELLSSRVPPKPCVLGAGSSIDNIPLTVCGEVLGSLRAILKRYTLLGYMPITSNTPSLTAWIQFFPLYPPISVSSPFLTGPTWNLPQFLSYQFEGIRGGSRYRYSLIRDATNLADTSYIPPYLDPYAYLRRLAYSEVIANGLNAWLGAYSNSPGAITTTSSIGVTTIPTVGAEVYDISRAVIEFEIPSQARTAFIYCGDAGTIAANVTPLNSGSQQGANVCISAAAGFAHVAAPTVYVNFNGRVEWSASEDFSFLGYQGPPIMDFGF